VYSVVEYLRARVLGVFTRELTEAQSEIGMIESELTGQIIGGAIEVHKYWGPGLYEEIYERSLCQELRLRNIEFKSQVDLPLIYKGETVGECLRLDIIVQNKIVIELKSVKELLPVHKAQIMTYMKLTDCKIGLLINFNVAVLKEGIQRFVI